jgi:hypothetical protein
LGYYQPTSFVLPFSTYIHNETIDLFFSSSGKLQILGLGTAIKILLSSDQDLEEAESNLLALHSGALAESSASQKLLLTRQVLFIYSAHTY